MRGNLAAPILEVFVSRQGEGRWVGEPMCFIRFGGCNLKCDYCDTPESIPLGAGSPWELTELLQQVERYHLETRFDWVTLTGGEPLLHVPYLEALVPLLRSRGLWIYLETNGTRASALHRVIDLCDAVAMDIKPASAIGYRLTAAQEAFLQAACPKAFVKLVLTATTREEELEETLSILEKIAPKPLLVLQPATPWNGVQSIPLSRLSAFFDRARERLPDVRVIPQAHRLWEIP